MKVIMARRVARICEGLRRGIGGTEGEASVADGAETLKENEASNKSHNIPPIANVKLSADAVTEIKQLTTLLSDDTAQANQQNGR